MAFGGSFKEDHPYATGLLLIVIAGFGIAGSVTGQLAAMLAALWVPTALQENLSDQNATGNTGGIGPLNGVSGVTALTVPSSSIPFPGSNVTVPGGGVSA